MHHVNPSLLCCNSAAPLRTNTQTRPPICASGPHRSRAMTMETTTSDASEGRCQHNYVVTVRGETRARRARDASGNYSFRLVNDVDCVNRGRARDARVG